jgi:hypothetical protein
MAARLNRTLGDLTIALYYWKTASELESSRDLTYGKRWVPNFTSHYYDDHGVTHKIALSVSLDDTCSLDFSGNVMYMTFWKV